MSFMQNIEEDEEPWPETTLSAEEAEELVSLGRDLMGMMISVKVEAASPGAGAAVRLAERVRVCLDRPDCRIQNENDGADAVLGPFEGYGDDPGPALAVAMTALGGSWEDVTVTTTSMGPVHYVVSSVGQGPDEAGAARIHLWAGTAWAVVKYIEELSP
jgi:hypothetical protein